MPYLIDQFGNKYDFKSEYDKALDERYWVVEIGAVCVHGHDTDDIVSELKTGYGFDVKKW